MKWLKWIAAILAAAALALAALWFWLPQDVGLTPRQKMLLGQKPLSERAVVARLVLRKGAREMDAYDEAGRLLKTYPVSLGFNPKGHKQFEGDGKTPEGSYTINDRNPNSGYHKNLGVSYPNGQDKAFAESQGKSPGGDIKIHGLPNGSGGIGARHLLRDWTNGCIAVTDAEVDELYRHVKYKAQIDILP
ncbi:L,D-transpeptidase family protein [Neisseria wadsworthii]|uniref:ErfK/YbiS/YcfS/YnhG family protein n=1 Tax=Neisseria wadsworthii 9715 TaxID=1030841 RepID=G4CP58_9NEIS|nr:L,D-transpeptidase family protein [Neisseria wadsworthii]EGZ48572.1 ErfK/YbiS/YcfS/YnhG family protein [Neisseria wadsworthii 9715]QMT34694.1 L,D-transpeptidase family protein [Neisseria wadsworthii]